MAERDRVLGRVREICDQIARELQRYEGGDYGTFTSRIGGTRWELKWDTDGASYLRVGGSNGLYLLSQYEPPSAADTASTPRSSRISSTHTTSTSTNWNRTSEPSNSEPTQSDAFVAVRSKNLSTTISPASVSPSRSPRYTSEYHRTICRQCFQGASPKPEVRDRPKEIVRRDSGTISDHAKRRERQDSGRSRRRPGNDSRRESRGRRRKQPCGSSSSPQGRGRWRSISRCGWDRCRRGIVAVVEDHLGETWAWLLVGDAVLAAGVAQLVIMKTVATVSATITGIDARIWGVVWALILAAGLAGGGYRFLELAAKILVLLVVVAFVAVCSSCPSTPARRWPDWSPRSRPGAHWSRPASSAARFISR